MSRTIPAGLWMADASRFDPHEQAAGARSSERVGLARITFETLRAPLGCRWRHGWILLTDEEVAEAAEQYGLSSLPPTGAIVAMPYPSPREEADAPC